MFLNVKSKLKIILVLISSAAAVLLFSFFYSQSPKTDHLVFNQAFVSLKKDDQKATSTLLGVRAANSSPAALPKAQNYDSSAIYNDTKKSCLNNNASCFSNELKKIAGSYGPEAALKVLKRMQEGGQISSSVDDHQIAHRIGRETAKAFGINGTAFLSCGTTFNYGCQHGFFEYALGKTSSTKEAASVICGSLESDPAYSPKFKFYCYHGLGHGVMMAQAYDLDAALKICDSLASVTAQDGCWQGVFMENANAGMRGEARSGIFSDQDPLAPCSTIAEKYRHECFINHAGWLMRVFANNVQIASAACLNAPTASVDACLQSIGLMVTNPSWQTPLALGSGDIPYKSMEEGAWRLCQKFPQQNQSQCVLGGVDNILNFDEFDVTRANTFCGLVADYKVVCYNQIGVSLRSQAVSNAIVVEKCASLGKWNTNCRRGAGL